MSQSDKQNATPGASGKDTGIQQELGGTAHATPLLSVVVPLMEPLRTGDGRELSELKLRRPKVRDVKMAARFGKQAEDQEIGLVAILVGVTPEDLDQVDLADWRKIQHSFRRMVDIDE